MTVAANLMRWRAFQQWLLVVASFGPSGLNNLTTLAHIAHANRTVQQRQGILAAVRELGDRFRIEMSQRFLKTAPRSGIKKMSYGLSKQFLRQLLVVCGTIEIHNCSFQ
jgi:hypothetical protein